MIRPFITRKCAGLSRTVPIEGGRRTYYPLHIRWWPIFRANMLTGAGVRPNPDHRWWRHSRTRPHIHIRLQPPVVD